MWCSSKHPFGDRLSVGRVERQVHQVIRHSSQAAADLIDSPRPFHPQAVALFVKPGSFLAQAAHPFGHERRKTVSRQLLDRPLGQRSLFLVEETASRNEMPPKFIYIRLPVGAPGHRTILRHQPEHVDIEMLDQLRVGFQDL